MCAIPDRGCGDRRNWVERENLAGSGTRWCFQLTLDWGPRVGVMGPVAASCQAPGTLPGSGPPSVCVGFYEREKLLFPLQELLTFSSTKTYGYLLCGEANGIAKMLFLSSAQQRGGAWITMILMLLLHIARHVGTPSLLHFL